VRRVRDRGLKVARAHLRHLDPLPVNTGDVLRAFPRVLVPEMNTGQLAQLLRGRYLVDVRSHTKVSGQPLFAAELEEAILACPS
jgi:2-oxoglutarate ferredoxin oxidoreductase subunit alpha